MTDPSWMSDLFLSPLGNIVQAVPLAVLLALLAVREVERVRSGDPSRVAQAVSVLLPVVGALLAIRFFLILL